jgi:hypothetical protein
MRTTIVAVLVASGTMIVLPVMAQQQTAPNQQMQDEASGESGYVADQEKPGSSAHAPGRPDTAPQTTGSGSGTSPGAAGSGERPR